MEMLTKILSLHHSAEPWNDETAVLVKAGSDLLLLGPRREKPLCDCRVLSEANYQRAVACVNAMAGIENPAEFMEKLKGSNMAFFEAVELQRDLDKLSDIVKRFIDDVCKGEVLVYPDNEGTTDYIQLMEDFYREVGNG